MCRWFDSAPGHHLPKAPFVYAIGAFAFGRMDGYGGVPVLVGGAVLLVHFLCLIGAQESAFLCNSNRPAQEHVGMDCQSPYGERAFGWFGYR